MAAWTRRVFTQSTGARGSPAGLHRLGQADDQGRQARGDPDLVANALGYGADVLAVADATSQPFATTCRRAIVCRRTSVTR